MKAYWTPLIVVFAAGAAHVATIQWVKNGWLKTREGLWIEHLRILVDLFASSMATLSGAALALIVGTAIYRFEFRRADKGRPLRNLWKLFGYGQEDPK